MSAVEKLVHSLHIQAFAQAYGLTQAEALTLEALAAGRSPRQIAILFDKSIFTVRNHIFGLRQKTDTASIRELLHLLSGPSPGLTPSPAGSASARTEGDSDG